MLLLNCCCWISQIRISKTFFSIFSSTMHDYLTL